MTDKMKYVSLCIPTNGIIEWVVPVIEKIYEQGVAESEFEVIVTDNGCNDVFKEKMLEIESEHSNFIYKQTQAFMFQNQIEALRLASGEYLKFLNHRALLEPNSLKWMIDLIKENVNTKPIIYLSNGALRSGRRMQCNSLDEFVASLGHIASWTSGVGVWKCDFDTIPLDHIFNKISPHSDVLFWVRKNRNFIVDDTKWSYDIDTSHKNKGKYDLYKAFAIEEPSIILGLYLDGDITVETLKKVINSYEKLVAGFYANFNLLKEECSYDISGFNQSLDVFLNKNKVRIIAYLVFLKLLWRRFIYIIKV